MLVFGVCSGKANSPHTLSFSPQRPTPPCSARNQRGTLRFPICSASKRWAVHFQLYLHLARVSLLHLNPDLPKPLKSGMFRKSYRDSNHDLGDLEDLGTCTLAKLIEVFLVRAGTGRRQRPGLIVSSAPTAAGRSMLACLRPSFHQHLCSHIWGFAVL